MSAVALSRTSLTVGDPDRSWLYAWSYDGLTIPSRVQFAASENPDYDPSYHGGWRLPAGTQPGSLGLPWADATITVVAPRKRKLSKVIPANENSLTRAMDEIGNGCTVLRLAAGEHVWDETLRLPAGVQVRGCHATIKGEAWPLFHVTGDDVGLYGINFVDEYPDLVSPHSVLYTDSAPQGLVVARCTFNDCNLGFWFPGALVRNNLFVGGGCGTCPGGLLLRNRFEGPSVQHALSHGSGLGPLATVDNFFDGHDRGQCFSAAKPITDFLSVGTFCRDIVRSVNGNEIALVEGPALFSRATFLHTRIIGCQSAPFQFDHVASDIYIRDLLIDGGPGIVLGNDDPNGRVERVTVEEFEMRNGAGIRCRPNAANNAFRRGGVYSWSPGRGNSDHGGPNLDRTVACWDEGAGNVLDSVRVCGTAAGCEDVRGFGRPK